ncbi:MAG: hypothetical protein KME10_08495 [Plectolyngbya sp. WJT66-NPBG17]|jgi:hypothetical protein|nr:hypothetical protein [Plectolyngbya sp. WJT66-NPBG17]MBW4524199.1 hypothetical protein [Phormidium tanganyikae FI6-MK23]
MTPLRRNSWTGLKTWFSATDGFSQRVARISSGIVILVGCLVLIGWSLDLSVLKSVVPGAATMKANTGLSFLLAGVSLGLQTRKRQNSLTARIAKGCAIAVSTIGLLTLSQYLFGWNLGIDELLFRDQPISPATSYPGRMGVNTAINFTFIGSALWLFNQRSPQRTKVDRIAIAQGLTAIASLIVLQAVVGYAYNVRVFYKISEFATSMALFTAISFVILGAGLLALKRDRGFMQTITSELIGGSVARRFMPAAIVVPLVLGWLILQGQQAGWYDPNFGLSLMSVSLVVILRWG